MRNDNISPGDAALFPVSLSHAGGISPQPMMGAGLPSLDTVSIVLAEAHSFLPGLAEDFLMHQQLPAKKELAVLFVDIADSTSTILRHPPEVALALLQRFMAATTEVALAHGGDVKDYEGDGALLYFPSVVDATRAALAIRAALASDHHEGGIPLQARLSLGVGEVIIGVIGSRLRRSIALVGPIVALASRLLKHIPPGGIIAPTATVERLRTEDQSLAHLFQPFGPCMVLKGFEEECVTASHIPSPNGPTVRGPELRTYS